MATAVYTTEEVILQDGTTVTLKPNNIKTLRKFMKKMEEFAKVENEEQGLDVLLDAAALCLAKEHPKYWDAHKRDAEDKPVGGFSEEFEEAADMDTIYRILDVCGGVKLNDPNLIAAAMEAVGQTSTS